MNDYHAYMMKNRGKHAHENKY